MAEFDLDIDFTAKINNLKAAIFNSTTELQLVWLCELIMLIIVSSNVNKFKAFARQNSKGSYIIVPSMLKDTLLSLNLNTKAYKCLVLFRNKFCHEGWIAARKDLKELLKYPKELEQLSLYCGVEIDLDNLQFNYI